MPNENVIEKLEEVLNYVLLNSVPGCVDSLKSEISELISTFNKTSGMEEYRHNANLYLTDYQSDVTLDDVVKEYDANRILYFCAPIAKEDSDEEHAKAEKMLRVFEIYLLKDEQGKYFYCTKANEIQGPETATLN